MTGLSVTDSTENSVLLGWSPVPGTTGYILRWTEVEGETSQFRIKCTLLGSIFVCVCYKCFVSLDRGTTQSETLPGSATSYRVMGLRLGRRYRFTVQSTFQNQVGPETSVEERTGYYTISVSVICDL